MQSVIGSWENETEANEKSDHSPSQSIAEDHPSNSKTIAEGNRIQNQMRSNPSPGTSAFCGRGD
jgi:hypothetical protein